MGMELIERIRECAYQLWEAEGCQHGRDMEYWFRAEAQVSSEQSAGAQTLSDSSAPKKSMKRAAAEGVTAPADADPVEVKSAEVKPAEAKPAARATAAKTAKAKKG
ncbi:MAG: DUF2934 domain-containing protein [Alphaproteobacteria bacterium]